MLEKEEENEALMLQHALADRLDENDFDLKEFEVIFLLFEIFAELILSDDQTQYIVVRSRQVHIS